MNKTTMMFPWPSHSPVPANAESALTHPGVLIMLAIIFLVLLKAIETALSARKYAQQQEELTLADACRSGMAVSPPAFASVEQADAVFLYANRPLYQFLLTELRRALKTEGYDLVTDRDRHAGVGEESKERIARHLFFARQQFLSLHGVPQTAPDYNYSEEARQLLFCLVKGCGSTGWHIAPLEAKEDPTLSTSSAH